MTMQTWCRDTALSAHGGMRGQEQLGDANAFPQEAAGCTLLGTARWHPAKKGQTHIFAHSPLLQCLANAAAAS